MDSMRSLLQSSAALPSLGDAFTLFHFRLISLLSRTWSSLRVLSTAGMVAVTISTAALNDTCTVEYVKAALPRNTTFLGTTPVNIKFDTVTANPVFNSTTAGGMMYPAATYDYCNVTLSYSHVGHHDNVNVAYWLPAPAAFNNRYLATGGGGYAINSGTSSRGSLPGGVQYGAVAGLTDAGFGNFSTRFDQVWLTNDGAGNLESLYMFGYKAINEVTLLGKHFTRAYFNMSSTKLYSYYQGCSEGGREGWSQVQRFEDVFDGVITGAPALRFSFQQVQHLYSNIVEQTLGYYPSPCELAKIVNETIAACDPLDGKTDGVVARTDLCKLHFDATSIVGKPYHCDASEAKMTPPFTPAAPEQKGIVTSEAVRVATTIINGLKDSNEDQVYFSYQPASSFSDATTAYDSTNETWGLRIMGFGSQFVTRFLQLVQTDTFDNLDGVTYDTLKEWMIQGWQSYEDTLHTTWPDLTRFQKAGGKILHYHGESDDSIPAASSVRYHDSVRQIMYGDLSYNASQAALSKWYKFYLVPGAGHCSPNELQPEAPFPQTNLQVMIDWVERGVEPVTLNATHLTGTFVGRNSHICAWPLRPLWDATGRMDCVYHQESIDSWIYHLKGIKLPVY